MSICGVQINFGQLLCLNDKGAAEDNSKECVRI